MKYRRGSIFIIISIFLLVSVQFAFADSGSHTLREKYSLELHDSLSMHISQINIGEGSVWFEIRDDGIQTAFFKLHEQEDYTYKQNDIQIYMQLEEVIQGTTELLARVYVMTDVPVGEPVEEQRRTRCGGADRKVHREGVGCREIETVEDKGRAAHECMGCQQVGVEQDRADRHEHHGEVQAEGETDSEPCGSQPVHRSWIRTRGSL